MKASTPEAAYLHIPFCRRRCFYCDFPISVLGDHRRGETSGAMAGYVQQLCAEIRQTPVLGGPLNTVFFGGGTPSLLSVEQLAQILTTLDHHFGLQARAEISMEMDPGTFELDHIQGYRALGVNRVSLGVQAFQDALLAACGRVHRVADVYQAVEHLQTVQIPCLSLDLISGLPHQTLADWQESLESAISLAPQHLSIYDLTLEPQTPFGRQYAPGDAPLPSDTSTVTMYRQAQQTLTAAGYNHYEISNYAQPGYQCQHNRTYWENRPYYGFGMGATSYTHSQRVSRPRTRREYAQWLTHYIERGGQHQEAPTPHHEQLMDQIMVGLRLQEGIALAPLLNTFGPEITTQLHHQLQRERQNGWVQMTDTRLRLTDPDGFLLSNAIIVKIFELLETPIKSL
jgi:putative oxygen-independent coproporphyrinogen III oxidase